MPWRLGREEVERLRRELDMDEEEEEERVRRKRRRREERDRRRMGKMREREERVGVRRIIEGKRVEGVGSGGAGGI